MRILAAGGGSGGHVTPVVAVLHEIKSVAPDAELRFWCDKKFATQAKKIIERSRLPIRVDTVVSGKFRRYHHLSKIQHVTISSVFWPNVRDLLFIMVGIVQSFVKLLLWRPNVVFTKGGYVCLPIGFAARILRIPLVIHDSDAHPGLTNRILSRWATSIATGAPLEHYPYPRSRSHYIGIPINSAFRPHTIDEVRHVREELGVSPQLPFVVVTGGGLGAKRLNDAIMSIAPSLTKTVSIMLISGVDQYRLLKPRASELKNFLLVPFVNEHMAEIMAAADVVVARAGATTILELAALKAPTILVPNPHLTGGHQLKNAVVYKNAGAVRVLSDDDITANPSMLENEITNVIANKVDSANMAKKFATFAKPQAARDMAKLILDASNRTE